MKKHPHFYIPTAKALFATTLFALGTISFAACAEHAPPALPAVTTTETTAESDPLQAPTVDLPISDTETESLPQTEAAVPVLRTEREEEREAIPYETVYEYSARYYAGTRVTKQEGQDGELLRVTIRTFADDRETDTTVTETVAKEPVASIVVLGTRDVVTYDTETVREPIPYTTETQYDATRYDDERIVLQKGSDGYAEVVYRITYRKGTETGRIVLSRETVEPVNAIISVGKMPAWKTETVQEKENSVSYQTEYIYDNTRPDGERTVMTKGQNGYTMTVYELKYYRGAFSSKTKKESRVIAPVNEVVRIGTKKEASFVLPFQTGKGYYLTQDFHSGHKALDFAIWYGDPIYAIGSGTVIYAYDEGDFSANDANWTYGTFVMIEHENGMRSLYAHLASRTVSAGDKVRAGQKIGTSGNTGRVNPMPDAANPLAGTHLHFEIRKKQNGAYVKVDPKQYLPDF